jgi:hypothetical protein
MCCRSRKSDKADGRIRYVLSSSHDAIVGVWRRTKNSAPPRVNAETRAALVAEIDNKGAEVFTLEAIDELEANNPELLQLAHSFASGLTDYLRAMQGFALLYKSLVIQAITERGRLH